MAFNLKIEAIGDVFSIKSDKENKKDAKLQFLMENFDENGEEIILRVEDDGPGIAPDVIDRVFDPFFSTKEPGREPASASLSDMVLFGSMAAVSARPTGLRGGAL